MVVLRTSPAANKIAASISFDVWSCCAHPPNSINHPEQLLEVHSEWLPALVPGTVASSLEAHGHWKIGEPLDANAHDWWYRSTFAIPVIEPDEKCVLRFDGLATLAEVWLNGALVLTSDNMFRAYRVDITTRLVANNELTIAFRSLANDLQQKRARPRWKANLVNHQQLRWRRTTLLGHIAGWSPPVAAVGPWRDVRLEVGRVFLSDWRLAGAVRNNVGTVTSHARFDTVMPVDHAVLIVGTERMVASIARQGESWLVDATIRVEDPPLWWPHTHGAQPLLDCSLEAKIGDEIARFELGKIGFRSIEVEGDTDFTVRVNGLPIYCRGACWTVSDIVALNGSIESLTHDLRLARDGGINMLRVGGTMIYENDAFYRLCDEFGILVWQDFMFANMDYPIDDASFEANIEAEATYQLGRLSQHPCIAVYCGNSEVEQQAAMLGVPRDLWRNRWFAEQLPALCAKYHPDAFYVPSTPSGGVMPFHVRDGITHYYGVGAYLRSPQELRRADVKFAPECLAFANIPDPATVDVIMNGTPPATHHPLWKQRVPRDTGAGWDFEDVRDHYLREFFGIDPAKMRSFDMGRYLQLSRVVTGEIMSQVFSEWRGNYSHNHGALVWYFKDLWPAAGCGIIDSLGNPKAAYYYLRRVWKNRQITITDEGLDGLHLHVINETASAFEGFVELLLLSQPHTTIARQEMRCVVPEHSRQVLQSDEILQGFYDVSYAYRFGPANHDIVIATLYDAKHEVVSEAVHFMHEREPAYLSKFHLQADAVETADGCFEIRMQSDCFLRSVYLDVKDFLTDDNFFHLAPLRPKNVHLRPLGDSRRAFKGYLEALNLRDPVKITVKTPVN